MSESAERERERARPGNDRYLIGEVVQAQSIVEVMLVRWFHIVRVQHRLLYSSF